MTHVETRVLTPTEAESEEEEGGFAVQCVSCSIFRPTNIIEKSFRYQRTKITFEN